MSSAESHLEIAEPPAVVALLMNRGDALARAAGATFLDLIARGVLRRVPGSGGGAATIGVGVLPTAGLLPYERHVYDHVVSRVVPGVGAPEGALCLESEEHEERWAKAFSDEVSRDARDRGLLSERTTLAAMVALSRTGPTELGKRRLAAYETMRTLVGTDAPGRMAAYALALGVPSRTAVSPFARQKGKVVWSKVTGSWRQIRVVDLPWLVGINPIAAVYALPGALVFFGIWYVLLSAYATRWHLIPTVLLPVAWLLWLLGGAVIGRFIYRGLYDLSHRSQAFVGQVVFLGSENAPDAEVPGKQYRVAIDDGQAQQSTQFEIDGEMFLKLRYGQWLRLELTPKLKYVRTATLLEQH